MPDILFLSHRVPYPPDKGEKIRAWHVLAHLAQRYRIHLGCLVDDVRDRPHLAHLSGMCASVGGFEVNPTGQLLRALAHLRPGEPLTTGAFFHAGLRRWVCDSQAATRLDAVFVYSSAMAPYAAGVRAPVRILDMVDVDSEKWRSYADRRGWPLRAIWRREAGALLGMERRLARQFDATLFVSEAEARRFAALAPESRDKIGWLENGVDADWFSPDLGFQSPFAPDTINLVFTGTMSYWPNGDAVTWFAREVMPLLTGSGRPMHFHIVGAKPSRGVQQLARMPQVHVTGRVADVRPYLAHADAVVAPLRVARGIQNKVLEAMAMARPVVATPEAFEGLRVVPERDLLVRASGEDIADALRDIIDGRWPGSAPRRGRRCCAIIAGRRDWRYWIRCSPAPQAWRPRRHEIEAHRAGSAGQLGCENRIEDPLERINHPLDRVFALDPAAVFPPETTAQIRLLAEAAKRCGQAVGIVARDDERPVFGRDHQGDIADIGGDDGQPGGHRLNNGIRHLLGIGGHRQQIEGAHHRLGGRDVAGEHDPFRNPLVGSHRGQPVSFGSVPADYQASRQISADPGKRRQQPRDILFRPQRRERPDHALAGALREALGAAWRRMVEAAGVDAVRDVMNVLRRKMPLVDGNRREVQRRDDDLRAPQHDRSRDNPPAFLALGLLGPEAVFEVKMRPAVDQAIDHRPFDRTPIVRHQRRRLGRGETAHDPRQSPDPARSGRQQRDIKARVQQSECLVGAIERDDAVTEPRPEPVRQRGKTRLLAADSKARENV